ncbi:DUF2938 domain-containing protein [Stutzerimonas stutzeri]|uniref:DUF2938 domain-containing protein n=1 Tax=Stutzerimonas stutzeri TaxID=316 RepID=UPI0020C5BCDA|nr:DUF2938 domain-containing protein [Stutzerimonas stutzeri]
MATLTHSLMLACGLGIGATAVMDLWLMLLNRLGVVTLNFAFIGRWGGHLLHGQWRHAAIAKSSPIRGELAFGWLLHYATGIAFAALLLALQGNAWAFEPTPLPALALGLATVMVPLFVIQPAMGSGFAARRTPTPLKNCLRSLANHGVFGLGLYLTAVALAGWLS